MCQEVLRDTILKIDLDALAYNMRQIKGMAGGDTAVMAVIKANAYGHGAVETAKTLLENGADYLAVATLTEALELREAYPEAPVFILGHTPDRLLHHVVRQRLTQAVVSLAQAKKISALAVEYGTNAVVHLKLDTGFHRLGFPCSSSAAADQLMEQLREVFQLDGLEIEGIFSHLALVDENENEKQVFRMQQVVNRLASEGFFVRYQHIADSISAVDYPSYRMSMIRVGALLFGLKGMHVGHLDVKPVMEFQTRISQIHRISGGEGVSYDFLWKAERDSVIGTLPFGYADGYPRNMRGKGYVTIRGVKAPILGVICMDQCMVDLTDVPGAAEGDIAVIYGSGENHTMDIAEAAVLAGTNKNEITARLAVRVPRVYKREGN